MRLTPSQIHTVYIMVLNRIEILDFKNIPEARLDFSPGVNCLVGLNGMGKSNMLEAIHMMCLARAMSSMPESALIRHGADMLAIKGDFTSDAGTEERVAVGIVRGKGKSLKRNGKEYDRISSHIGAFPLVSVTPADSMLVSGSAEERRRLTDMVIPDFHFRNLLSARSSAFATVCSSTTSVPKMVFTSKRVSSSAFT